MPILLNYAMRRAAAAQGTTRVHSAGLAADGAGARAESAQHEDLAGGQGRRRPAGAVDVRGGAVAVGWHLFYAALFAAMGIGLWSPKTWGSTRITSGMARAWNRKGMALYSVLRCLT